MNRVLRLTKAQEGALECRVGGGLGRLTRAAWNGRLLSFPESWEEALWSELGQASNAEDAQAEMLRAAGEREAATLAGRAARSLGVLAGRVLLGERSKVEPPTRAEGYGMKQKQQNEDLTVGTPITFHRGSISYEGTITSRDVSDGIVIYGVDYDAPGGGPPEGSVSIHNGQIDRVYS